MARTRFMGHIRLITRPAETTRMLTERSNGQREITTLRQLRSRLRPYEPMLTDVIAMFILSRLLFYVASAVSIWAIPAFEIPNLWTAPAHPLVLASWRWDGGWYASIIKDGYVPVDGQSNVVFFPLYPFLVKIVLLPFSIESMWIVGVLVTHAAFLFALVAVWLYVNDWGGRRLAQRTLFLLAIFPTSFFFNAAYTESLFLLTTATSLLMLQRHRYVLSGAAGFFAALTRPPGVYLAIPFALHLILNRSKDWRENARHAAGILLIPAGIFTYMAYLYWRFGDPLLFLDVQDAWRHEQGIPFVALYEAIDQVLMGYGEGIGEVMNIVNTVAAILAIALGLLLLRRHPVAATWVLIGALVPLSSPVEGTPTLSLARYVVVLFPMFIPLARWTANSLVMVLVAGVFLPLNVLLTALFVQWYRVV